MIPTVNGDLQADFEIVEQPTKTYRLNGNKISGYVDGLEAMRQAVFLILNAQRYEHIIYSWNYGVETRQLIGQPKSLVLSELKRLITEALTQDTRITGVSNFEFKTSKRQVHATFTVSTIYGEVKSEAAINV